MKKTTASRTNPRPSSVGCVSGGIERMHRSLKEVHRVDDEVELGVGRLPTRGLEEESGDDQRGCDEGDPRPLRRGSSVQ